MARRKDTGLEAHYGELLDEQEESGLSVAAFAEEVGLSAATLYGWRRRLGRASRREGGGRLVEVRVTDDHGGWGAPGRMVVAKSDGTRIELAADFDDAALERLLVVLGRC